MRANWIVPLLPAAFAVIAAVPAATEPLLFVSQQLTPKNEYTSGIEGPAVDAGGALYVVNFGQKGTIGRLRHGEAHSSLFATLPAGSVGNGIRFDRQGRMFVADYRKHNVLVLAPGATAATVYFHSATFHQPNDLAIASDGTLFASDPDFAHHGGRIWRIAPGSGGLVAGSIMTAGRTMGTTNGIDLSPDDKTLYVSESEKREVWAYDIEGAGLANPRLLRRFGEGELDGLRADTDGRLLVTRPGPGTVAILAPDGSIEREVKLLGKSPTNLTFGGTDGRTIYVTQADGRFIEHFAVERPGREYCLYSALPCPAPP